MKVFVREIINEKQEDLWDPIELVIMKGVENIDIPITKKNAIEVIADLQKAVDNLE